MPEKFYRKCPGNNLKDVFSKELMKDIKSKIYTVRGKQVILDRELAKLYEVETRRLNEK